MTGRPSTTGSWLLFLSLVLVVLTLATMAGFQSSLLYAQRENLTAVIESQKAPKENAERIRAQLREISLGVGRLAQNGHPYAQRVVESLKQRGVSINP